MQYLESQGSIFKYDTTNLIKIKQQFNDAFDLIKHYNLQEQEEILQYVQHCINTNNLLLEVNKNEDDVKKSGLKELKSDNKLVNTFFKCRKCNKRSKTKLGLLKHLQRHKGSSTECIACNKTFKNKLSYFWHRKHLCKKRKLITNKNSTRCVYYLQKRNLYKCLTCNKFFPTKTLAYFHYKSVHLVKNVVPQFCCRKCLHTFHRIRQFHKHICQQKDQATTISQTICDKPYSNQYFEKPKTKSISRTNKFKNNYKCATCDKNFLQKYLLNRHIRRSHLDKTTLLSCKYCNYKSRLKPNMERHRNLHFSNEKNCMCDHCGKTFTNTASLMDHIKYLHIQEKQFKCEMCEKSFKRKFELVRHRSCHSEVRPYVCELCQQTYKRLNHLSRHQKTAHQVLAKSKTVQRLKVNETGVVIPIPKEKPLDLETKPGVSTSTNTCILLQHQPGIRIINNVLLPNHVIFGRNLQPEEHSYSSVIYQIE